MMRVLLVLLSVLWGTLLAGERPEIPGAEVLAKLPKDGGSKWNRLVFEASPYLQQHAANPVDWYPWGDEAFLRAKEEDKPIFLSVGYATCHWCHVMERESFQDPEIAALLNQHFINIKVDREERPDVDEIYMTACRLMTGSAGWPLTVMLDHQKRPFFAGTYFPKKGRTGRPGMLELVPRMAGIWRDNRDSLQQYAARMLQSMKQQDMHQPGELAVVPTLQNARKRLGSIYDGQHGGFGPAPRFPTPQNITFLLRQWRRNGDEEALAMAVKSLKSMRLGGIYDHLGLGFHRYAVDEAWLVPHFEKMLYDQALLALAYLEAFQATRDPFFARTAREIFTFVLRDMTSAEGGFFSAIDAESEGEEGKFYVWTLAEILAVLGPEEGAFFAQVHGIREGGNFKPEVGEATDKNIIHLQKEPRVLAAELGLPLKQLEERWSSARGKLLASRNKRPTPLLDDKVLTDWNGLMIAALARGGRVLQEPRYGDAARRAAGFLLTNLRDGETGDLMKRWRAGSAGLEAHLNDYAFLIWGLVELYECTFDPAYLTEALELQERMTNHFWDKQRGGLFSTADRDGRALMRTRGIFDGAIPSGNSIAAMAYLRLARLTGRTELEERAHQIFSAFAEKVSRGPLDHGQLLQALDFSMGSYEVVVVGSEDDPQTRAMIAALFERFIPNKVVILKTEDRAKAISRIAPYTAAQNARNNKATAYVCQNFACNMPTTDISVMLKQLGLTNTSNQE